jgi:hypothetical protein
LLLRHSEEKIFIKDFLKKNKIDEDFFRIMSLKFISDESYKINYFLEKKIKTLPYLNSNKLIQKEMSKQFLYNNLRILKNLCFRPDFKIYFPFFFDFRGRFYYNSSIAPTNLKFSRYVYNYGVYKKEDFLNYEESSISQIIKKHGLSLDAIKKKFNIKKNDL